jgi:hypothetical protein
MDPNQPRKAGQLFEYFLYTAIILETGLAAFVYKVAFQDGGLGSLKIYFGLLYYAFLAWAVSQLNKLHRKRRLLEPELEPEPELPAEPVASETAPAPTRQREHSRLLLGLTIAQLAIVVIVFGTAVATYSWAFSVLRSGQ